jgi:hypothetical protein
LIYVDGTIVHLTGYDREGNILASASLDWLTISVLPGIISIDNSGIVSFAFTWEGGGTPGPNGPIDDVVGIDNLTFEAEPPHGKENHVPDAGSTLTLLGIALGVIRFMRRR